MVHNTGIILRSSLVQIGSQMKWSHPQENFFLYATRSAHRFNKIIYTGWKNVLRWWLSQLVLSTSKVSMCQGQHIYSSGILYLSVSSAETHW